MKYYPKIDEEVIISGNKYKCIENDDCSKCAFDKDNKICKTIECYETDREDKKSIIMIKID